MSKKKKLTPEQKLQKLLDDIVEPLIQQTKTKCAVRPIQDWDGELYMLFATAVLRGIEFAEVEAKQIQDDLVKQEDEGKGIIQAPITSIRRAKTVSAIMNINNPNKDQFKRFVTPDELDENGNLKKG